jgi:Flp pilus assembly protein TadG
MTFIGCIRPLARERRGVALVEFACVLPVLLLMYVGGFQLTDALSCNRKVTISARAVADLTTQNATVTLPQVTAIINASGKIMAPYDIANATVQVSEIQTDASGKSTVVWSKNNKGGGYATGASYNLPANIKVNGSYIIVGQVTYAYKPPMTFGTIKNLSLGDTIYMNPRVSNSVDWKS